MTDYMLDTDICIYFTQRKFPALVKRFQTQAGRLHLSVITVAELLFGAEKSAGREHNLATTQSFIDGLRVHAFSSDAAQHYAEIRAHLEKAGTPCGANDMLIGAHARSLGMTLVTNNRREFDRMPGLAVENWV
jgi:tRNA(fMet)-specific endonuclease VapC